MRAIRRLAWLALVLGFVQVVFGAIVRITGSGMGCGDHWPKCAGAWFPPHDRLDLVIEVTHRYIALGLSLAILALVVTAYLRRAEPGVGGRGGALRPALLAGVLVVAAALVGAVTVRTLLSPLVVVAHLSIAMALLATLALTVSRAGGLGAAAGHPAGSDRSRRAAGAAVGLALSVLVLGALTANLAGAAASCGGFPWCRTINAAGSPLVVNIVHRVLAFLLFAHLLGIALAARRRSEPAPVTAAAWAAFAAVSVQVLVAAAMVEMQFPALLRSLHQAAGTLVWLATVILAIVTTRRGVFAETEA